MSTQNIYALTDTWNAAGTTFTAIKMNVTDTASAAGSLLIDLQTGGTSQFSVRKDGLTTAPRFQLSGNVSSAAWTTSGIGLTNVARTLTDTSSSGTVATAYTNVLGGNTIAASSATTYTNYGTLFLGSPTAGTNVTLTNSFSLITAGNIGVGSTDVVLARDAADTLAQRRSTNAQAFRVYNTFTDTSNYERAKITWSSNVLQIGTENLGSGTARALELQTNGTGRWQVNTSGHFIGVTDNSFDIGQFNANRPRNLFIGGDAYIATLLLVRHATGMPAGGSTGVAIRLTNVANFGVFCGSGVPTISAAKGSLYLRSDGTTTNDRAYINTDGATTWTAVTTVA